MTSAQAGGRGRRPRPLVLPEDLLAYVRKYAARVNRADTMRRFNCSREMIDRCRTVVRYEEGLTNEQKADRICDWLWDNRVKQVIDDRLDGARSARKLRRARAMGGELETERRQAEAFRREGLAAKRPYEYSLDLQIELLKAAQLVVGLHSSFDSLDPAGRERVTTAFDRLDQQMVSVREKIHPPPPSAFNGIVIDSDMYEPVALTPADRSFDERGMGL